eukprot:363452-Chlamydomonas_euryale.AAC.3
MPVRAYGMNLSVCLESLRRASRKAELQHRRRSSCRGHRRATATCPHHHRAVQPLECAASQSQDLRGSLHSCLQAAHTSPPCRPNLNRHVPAGRLISRRLCLVGAGVQYSCSVAKMAARTCYEHDVSKMYGICSACLCDIRGCNDGSL